jgi:nitric-oxide synthase
MTNHCPVHPPASAPLALAEPVAADDEVDLDEAEEFIRLFHGEHPDVGDVERRVAWVRAEVLTTGTYQHTTAELAFGARVAWRNSARCIGRLYWQSLRVRDMRAVRDADRVAAQCARHLQLATNGGKIRPVISVFAPNAPGRPAPRIWNEQLVRYAGYRTPDGVLGDPRYVDFTDTVRDLGWRPPVQPGRLYQIDPGIVLEVPLHHPDLQWFADLGLRWHAVPAISNMPLSIGGITYPAAPFNGWYLGTEIGARNLVDADRYDMLEPVAQQMGLDTSREQTLWRDRAAVEINRAVLHSFELAGVTIADHHTEAKRFLTHLAKEERAGRECPADWTWIVPPISGALTPVFHRYYSTESTGPQFLPPTGGAY